MAGNRHPPSQVGEDLSRKLYFFLGNQYVRFNMLKNRAEEGYPEATSKRWAGLNFDRVGAAVYWGNAKVFFFRGRSLSRKMSHFQLWFCVVSCHADHALGEDHPVRVGLSAMPTERDVVAVADGLVVMD